MELAIAGISITLVVIITMSVMEKLNHNVT
jgi:hypothetical protein